ncbi:MAG: prepilin peptidase [Lachnospiraceae bacterium]|nr:prepilin peptidase [Lachnospiraceae bacterium]
MQIAIEIIITAMLLAASYFYLKLNNKDEKYKCDKKLIIYHIIMLLVLSGIVVQLNLVYVNNSMVHNTKLMILLSCLVPLGWKDYFEYKIPNVVILFMLSARVVTMIWELIVLKKLFLVEFKDCFIAFAFIGIFLILVHIIFKNSIGMGDIKLMMMMALYQGFYGVFSSIFFSMISVCILAIILMIAKKKKRKDSLPFAPAVLFGTCISVFMSGI